MLSLQGYTIRQLRSDDRGVATFDAVRSADSGGVIVRFVPRNSDVETMHGLLRDFSISQSLDDIALHPIERIEVAQGTAIVFDAAGTRPLRTLAEEEPFGTERFLKAALAILASVVRLHAQNIIHKNLNLDSIWLDEARGVARLAGFSIASHTPHGGERSLSKLEGALPFISPEQTGRVNRSVDARTDCYALGVVFYRLLAGRLPFLSVDPLELIHSHLATQPPSLASIVPQVPRVLSAIVDKMLAKTPDARYQRLAALERELQECLSQWRAQRDIAGIAAGDYDARHAFIVPQKLYGRERQIGVLEDALRDATSGRTNLVLVHGEPGIGKTALVEEIRGAVAIDAGYFIAGKFDQYKRNVPYSAIVSAFQELVREILGEAEGALASWRARLLEALGEQAQIVIDVIPEVELVIGSQPTVATLPSLEGRNRFVRVFRDFIRSFASVGRPLVLFLDDVQWTDSASLSLLEALVTDAQSASLLLICAYRDTELDAAHPFAQMLASLSDSVVQRDLAVAPLTVEDVNALVADALGCEPRAAKPLAAVLHTKTTGNPFFLSQFLQLLVAEELVQFSQASGRWEWSLQEIDARGAADNVVDLMSAKIRRLSTLAQDVLKIAAGISNCFDLQTLGLVSGIDIDSLCRATREALREGILLAPATAYTLADDRSPADGSIALTAELRFLHDRVQQAAYALVPLAQRPALSLSIGRLLFEQWQKNDGDELPFDIVNHLNAGRALLQDAAERKQLARSNLQVARRARASTAYSDALQHLEIAGELLGESVWDDDYPLAYALHMERLECEYQAGNPENADRLFEALLARVTDPIERAKVFYTKILVETNRNRNDLAIELGLVALAEFGVRVPKHPGAIRLLVQMLKVRVKVRGRSPNELAALPSVQDPAQRMVMQLLMSICPAAYFSNPDVMTYAALKIVDLTLSHGNAPSSSYGYVLYALVLGVFGNYKDGYAFGRLADEMSARDEDVLLRCKVSFIFGGLVNFWRGSVDSSIAAVRASYRASLDAGDIQYATYSLQFLVQYLMFRGASLAALQDECASHVSFTAQTKDVNTINTLAFRQYFIGALRGVRNDDVYDEAAALAAERASGNVTSLAYQLIPRLQMAYLFGHYTQALALVAEAQRNIRGVLSQVLETDFHFYAGLTAAALLRDRPNDRRLTRRLRRSVKLFRKWSTNQPDNFEQQASLLAAELAIVSGRAEQALLLYDSATASARDHDFVHVQAMSDELAARHFFRIGDVRRARTRLERAYDAYVRWGATAKARALEDEFGALVGSADAAADRAALELPTVRDARLDIDSVMKASRAVAAGASTDQLIRQLMAIALEYAGGSYGSLVIVRNDRFEARAFAATNPERERDATSLADVALEPLVRFVARTREDVVVDDVRDDRRFGAHPYVRRNALRSVLACPVVSRGVTLGVLYFENNLVTGAFTPDRLQTLRTIANEFANVLDSAHLRAELTSHSESLTDALGRVDVLEKAKHHLTKFVPQSVQRIIDANPHDPHLAKREQDISVLFLDVEGYTRLSQQFDPEAVNSIIEQYFSAYLDDIHRNGGDINETLGDGLMIVFQDPDPAENALAAARAACAIGVRTRQLNRQRGTGATAINVNIGINSGVASVGSTRLASEGGTRYTYTASGQVTNLAARIAALASDGAILVGATTAARIGDEFELVDRGEQRLKNVVEPQRVFELIGARRDADTRREGDV